MRRVHVVGTSGSGKSTVAATLAARCGLRHVELDALSWQPGWVQRPTDELLRAVDAATAGDGWVVDGNYGAEIRALVWPKVDTVVWLDLPRSTVMRQVTSRTLRRWWRGEILWGTNREQLRTTLFSRESVVWWAWSTHARRRAEYGRLLPIDGVRLVWLRTRAEVDRWLGSL